MEVNVAALTAAEKMPGKMFVEVKPENEDSLINEMRGNTDPLKTEDTETSTGKNEPSEQPEIKENEDLEPGDFSLAGVVDGEFIVEFGDSALSSILTFLVVIFLKTKLPDSSFSLTQKEKNKLIPYVDKFIESTSIKTTSPGMALLYAIIAIYGAKIISLIPDITERKKEHQEKKKKDIAEGIERAKGNNLPVGRGSRGGEGAYKGSKKKQ